MKPLLVAARERDTWLLCHSSLPPLYDVDLAQTVDGVTAMVHSPIVSQLITARCNVALRRMERLHSLHSGFISAKKGRTPTILAHLIAARSNFDLPTTVEQVGQSRSSLLKKMGTLLS